MFETIIYVVGAAIVIMLASLSGLVLFTKKLEKWTHHNIRHLVSFSAGVFLLVAVDLSRETFELAPSVSHGILFIVAGALIVFLISLAFPDGHQHHHAGDDHIHDKAVAKRLLFGDALHNIADGVLLVPAFIVDQKLGIAATISIFIHEFVQEISEFIVLREAGYTVRQALSLNLLTASTIFIGITLGFFLTSSNTLTAVLLGIAAGVFFYTVLVDLFPSAFDRNKPKRNALMLLWLVLGAVVVLGVNALT